jgi:F0F1-type ATP synthase assembly protein I
MLVTCPECERKISEYTVICPHCGFQGDYYEGNASHPMWIRGAGYYSPESTEERKEIDRKWKREKKEAEEKAAQKAAQLAAEEKSKRVRETRAEAERKRRKEDIIIFSIMFIVLMGAVVGAIFGIKYLALEIWRFISALF